MGNNKGDVISGACARKTDTAQSRRCCRRRCPVQMVKKLGEENRKSEATRESVNKLMILKNGEK